MAIKPEKTIEARVKAEVRRLNQIYKNMDPVRKAMAEGLVKRAAFMRVQLEDLELDLMENGWTEPFSQGNQDPYDRARPSGQSYNTLNSNYQKIIKQLDALMPKAPAASKLEDDGFDRFVLERDGE